MGKGELVSVPMQWYKDLFGFFCKFMNGDRKLLRSFLGQISSVCYIGQVLLVTCFINKGILTHIPLALSYRLSIARPLQVHMQ